MGASLDFQRGPFELLRWEGFVKNEARVNPNEKILQYCTED